MLNPFERRLLLQKLNASSDSYLINSWWKIYNDYSLDLFYSTNTHTFSAAVHNPQECTFIPNFENGVELITFPLFDCKLSKTKLTHLNPLKLVELFRKELQFPLITKRAGRLQLQLKLGGRLLGGGNTNCVEIRQNFSFENRNSKEYQTILGWIVEFIIPTSDNKFQFRDKLLLYKQADRIFRDLSDDQVPLEKQDILELCEKYRERKLKVVNLIYDYLKERYEAKININDSKYKDEILLLKLSERIFISLDTHLTFMGNFEEATKSSKNEQSLYVKKLLDEKIDQYETEYFEDLLMEILDKNSDQDKLQQVDYIKKIKTPKLCLKLLEKGYFARERAKDSLRKQIVDRMLAKLTDEIQQFITNSNENLDISFERLLELAQLKEQTESLLRPLRRTQEKVVYDIIRKDIKITTIDPDKLLKKFYSSHNSKAIFNEIVKEVNKKSTSNFVIKSDILPFLNKLRLDTLNELNLFDHDLSTVVELYNLLKSTQSNDDEKNSKLTELERLLDSVIARYRDEMGGLNFDQLGSLLPLACVKNKDLYRSFMIVFLQHFQSDLLFDLKKCKMLSFILISAIKNGDTQDYFNTDDLLVCFQIIQQKIDNLSINTKNINFQEAMDCLNDILFLMSIIKAKGVQENIFNKVRHLTKHLEISNLQKIENFLTQQQTDRSLEIKSRFTLQALNRIQGTNYDIYKSDIEKIEKAGKLIINVGRGLLLADPSSIGEALFQIKEYVLLLSRDKDGKEDWFTNFFKLRFLEQEPIEKIMRQIFNNNQSYDENYSFFAAKFLLDISSQPNRATKEKKAAIEALCFMVNGYDYLLSITTRSLVDSKTFKKKDIVYDYIKNSLNALTLMSDPEMNTLVKQLLDIQIEKYFEINNPLLNELVKSLKDPTKPEGTTQTQRDFYLKILKEDSPKLFAFANIQEKSKKNFEKPPVIIKLNSIDAEKDFESTFQRKMKEKVEKISDTNRLEKIIEEIKFLNPQTATKNKFNTIINQVFNRNATKENNKNKALLKQKEALDAIEKKTKEIMKENSCDFFDDFDNFLKNSSKKVMLVQGDAGSGKTFLLSFLEQKLWKKYNLLTKSEERAQVRLPLRIILAEVKNFNHIIEEFLFDNGCTPEKIEEIKNEPVIIMFDGYDEIDRSINLYNQCKLKNWRDAKVVITSRKEGISSASENDNYLSNFAPDNDEREVQSVSILPLDENDIKKYFQAQVTNQNLELAKKYESKDLSNICSPKLSIDIQNMIDSAKSFLESEKTYLSELEGILEENLTEIRLDLDQDKKGMPKESNLYQITQELKELQESQIKNRNISNMFSLLNGIDIKLKSLEEVECKVNSKEYPLNENLSISTVDIFLNSNIFARIMGNFTNKNEFMMEMFHIPFIYKVIGHQTHIDDEMTEMNYIYLLIKRFKKLRSFTNVSKIAETVIQKISGMISKILKQVHEKANNLVSPRLREVESKVNGSYFKTLLFKVKESVRKLKSTEKQLRNILNDEEKEFRPLINKVYQHLLQVEESPSIQQIGNLLKDLNEKVTGLKKREKEMHLITPKNKESLNEKNIMDLKSDLKLINEIHRNIAFLHNFDKDIIDMLYIGWKIFYENNAFQGNMDQVKKDLGRELKEFCTEINELRIFTKETVESYELSEKSKSLENHLGLLLTLAIFQHYVKETKEKVDHVLMIKEKLTNPQGYDFNKVYTLQRQLINLQKFVRNEEQLDYISKLIEMINDMKEFDQIYGETINKIPVVKTSQKIVLERIEEFADQNKLDMFIKRFIEIISSPLVLNMLVQTLLKFPISSTNKSEIYRLFINAHFENQRERLLLKKESIPPKLDIIHSFYNYSKDLAVNMFFRKNVSIQHTHHNYQVLGVTKSKKKNIWARFFENDTITKISRKGAQIVETEGVIRFVNKSIMEYFVARQFYDEIIYYNSDNIDNYDPCLDQGPIIEQETSVYGLLKSMIEFVMNNRNREFELLNRKILEIFNSDSLLKKFGEDFDNDYFYPNIFLIILLNKKLALNFTTQSKDSTAILLVHKLFEWIFNDSDASHKFVKILDKANLADPKSYKHLQVLLYIHYDYKTTPNSPIKFQERSQTINIGLKVQPVHCDRFDEEKSSIKHQCQIEAKLFIYGSQDSIVVLKNTADKKKAADEKKYLAIDLSNPDQAFYTFVSFNAQDSPWDKKECKWILRMDEFLQGFTLISLSDSSQTLKGSFRSHNDYTSLFGSDVCSRDVYTDYITSNFYTCITCGLTGDRIICRTCKDICHNGHQVNSYADKDISGYCDCRFEGTCKIAKGCSARFVNIPDYEMYRYDDIVERNKNVRLCLYCRNHADNKKKHFIREKSEEGFNDECGCNCTENRAQIIAKGYLENISKSNAKKYDNYIDGEGDSDDDEETLMHKIMKDK